MAGYILHMFHAYETYMRLSCETKEKMPENVLRNLMIGAVVPDLVSKDNKYKTHFYRNHPIYGEYYKIPDIKKAEKLFMKKNPVYLGVLSHLKYDLDHIERFLLVYAKPCMNSEYENTLTGERMSGLSLFGNSNDEYGQLYKLYDKFNGEITGTFIPRLNNTFGTNFSEDKDGFLGFIKWMFPNNIPLSGIKEMDDYRIADDIMGILKCYFVKSGNDCRWNVKIDSLVNIVEESASELSRKIDELYIEK